MEAAAEETPKESTEPVQAGTNSAEKVIPPNPPPTMPQPDQPKKSKREDRNKKEDEYVKQFMKEINAASTVEEKIQVANQKYSHMVEDNKKMQFYINAADKRLSLLLREKEQLQLEFMLMLNETSNCIIVQSGNEKEKVIPPNPPPTMPQPDQAKKSKREDRNKKEDEYVKQFMKEINAASTVEEKIQVANQKYSHMVEDNKKMQFYIKAAEKRHSLLLREKEQLQLEFNKTILVKSKLENLCRELQKQNKAIKDESLHKIREEEERRKETQAKFQNTLSEITALLHQNNEKNTKLRDDNISMTEKFKSVVQQYQLREQQVEKMTKQMALEQQLADAKFLKAGLEHQAEKERLLAEMEGLKVSVAQHRAKIMELQGTENGLRSQLAVYTDKYDEFQNALVKSNQVFGGFKEEMEKMSKKIKKLEKESLSWKKRWETSQTALLEMCAERQTNEERAAAAARQLHNMQSLCRTMQTERTILLNTLKEHNIERPPLPAPSPAPPAPPAPAPPAPALAHQPASNAKVDAMAANCAQLRQSLAHLQSQLNVLTTKQQSPTPSEEPCKSETKTKKSKSKKSKKVIKESESDSNTKESATESANEEKVKEMTPQAESTADKLDEVQAVDEQIETVNAVGVTEENATKLDVTEDKVDDKTLESLIQAINNANINLCDLEVVGDDKIDIDDILDADSLSKDDEITKSTDTASNDASEIDTSNKDVTSNEVSPKNGPKIIELPDDFKIGGSTGVKIVEITEEELNKQPKIVEIVEEAETTTGARLVEIIDEDAKASNIGVPKEVKEVANKGIKASVDAKSTTQDA